MIIIYNSAHSQTSGAVRQLEAATQTAAPEGGYVRDGSTNVGIHGADGRHSPHQGDDRLWQREAQVPVPEYQSLGTLLYSLPFER